MAETLNDVEAFKSLQQDLKTESVEVKTVDEAPQVTSQQPVCLASQYFDFETKKCIDLKIYYGSLNEIFRISLESADGDANQQKFNSTYRIVSASSTEIKVQFNFTDPLQVTTADKI